MRMWMVKPSLLCRKHLLGEHLETHLFVGSILEDRSLSGYVDRGLVQAESLAQRHEDLVVEMLMRGYNHQSELPEFFIPQYLVGSQVNVERSIADLKERCSECRSRIEREAKDGLRGNKDR